MNFTKEKNEQLKDFFASLDAERLTFVATPIEKGVETKEFQLEMAKEEFSKKLEEKDALELCYKAINEGACGVDMGRNVFQSDSPVAMIQAVRAVVHEKYTPEQAFQLFNDLKHN